MNLRCIVVSLCLCASAAGLGQSYVNDNLPHIPKQLIVRFKENTPRSKMSSVIRAAKGRVIDRFLDAKVNLIEFDSAKTRQQLRSVAASLLTDSSVLYVEANQIINADGVIPNDPRFGEQYGMHNIGQNSGLAGADINAPEAWGIETGERTVIVAVIDTGVQYAHADLKLNMWKNAGEGGREDGNAALRDNGIDDDGNGLVDDWRGWDFANQDNDPRDDHGNYHGTHVAGIIGAVGNNGLGVAGVNWAVSLMPIKALAASGHGTIVDVVKAVDYATNMGAKVINCSWGSAGYSPTLFDSIQSASNAGVLVVAAAGNNSRDIDLEPHYPGAYSHANIITVAATDRHDRLAGFSNYGIERVDIAAPGVDILSTVSFSSYDLSNGTSMATPHVSGAAALILAQYPSLSVDELKRRLLYGADRREGLSEKMLMGARLNTMASIENDSLAPAPVGGLGITERASTGVTLRWMKGGDDGQSGSASSYEMRRSSAPILSELDWRDAIIAKGRLVGSGDQVQGEMPGLPLNFSGHVSVRAIDNVGNLGGLGGSVAISTLPVSFIYRNSGETTEGLTIEGSWGVESLDGRKALSDSPAGAYENETLATLTFPKVATRTGMALVVVHKYHLERNHDFGYVEYSSDGSSWTTLRRYTGEVDWQQDTLSLPDPSDAAELKIRLRLTSDYVIRRDGWQIDELSIIGDAEVAVHSRTDQ